jgi:hypothetical protein
MATLSNLDRSNDKALLYAEFFPICAINSPAMLRSELADRREWTAGILLSDLPEAVGAAGKS